ncbi:VOC family protein [Deinococcus sp. MIMF12]|uniref:VOC family protein n=1 Tax=Deinococcus rhizophilus TaxID=3049544 RepID=A0ABT7JFB8_9DEIO|nr:VOC family protein [Deinococcus rhizophilus]MDL2343746.1 VOC family protein [Deinococcus rhizophilus]
MLRIGSVVWGVQDVRRALEFWTQALDYRPRDEPDDDWVVLVPREGHGVQLALKRVTSPQARRHHLDLYAGDQAAEAGRLVGLGAVRVEWTYEPDADYVVLADPDGNRFCVVQKGEA